MNTKAFQSGCIKDIAAIGKIVTKLASLPAAMFQSQESEIFLYFVRNFFTDFEMDKSRCLELSCGEVLGVIELIPSSHFYHVNHSREYYSNMRLVLVAHISYLLREFYLKSDIVHLFMSTTVKGYLDYLASKAGATNIYEDFRQTVLKDTGFLILDDTTIMRFLEKMFLIHTEYWLPIVPINEFEHDIRRCYEILYDFYITYFKEAFPEYFDLERLREKYKPRVKPRGM